MPELPEVETVRRTLARHGIVGRVITDAVVNWPRSVGGDPSAFVAVTRGHRIADTGRRGKYLLLPLDNGTTILVHLRMSGRLWIDNADAPLSGYERVRLRLEDGRELRFHDPRKFGRMQVTNRAEIVLADMGFEPLEGSEVLRRDAWRSMTRRRKMIKALLLDQRAIAGLGNIYTDEALWLAAIAPDRRADTLSESQRETLRVSVENVLIQGIENFGTALGEGKANFILPDGSERARNQENLAVFHRTGKPCPRCGARIDRIVVAGRSTHICPRCQPVTDAIRRDSSS